MNNLILQVAVPAPLDGTLDYLIPAALTQTELTPGMRVRVPLGRRQVVGILLSRSHHSTCAKSRLKPISECLDQQPLLPESVLNLLLWASRYYRHPIGQVLLDTLPRYLSQGKTTSPPPPEYWVVTPEGRQALGQNSLRRAPQQAKLLTLIEQSDGNNSSRELSHLIPGASQLLKKLQSKSLATPKQKALPTHTDIIINPAKFALNDEQKKASLAVIQKLHQFCPFLLAGITGSGKTEVYLEVIEAVVRQKKQALILVPEIALTQQTLERFQQRFHNQVVLLHSALSDTQRYVSWLKIRNHEVSVILGTRSAVFVPMVKPGLIIVDEEHDTSYKQQNGFHYSARDCAIMRAHLEKIPIILGSATPSMESFHNSQQSRYQYLTLTQRAGKGTPPHIHLIDLGRENVEKGLSRSLMSAIKQTLSANQQALIFLNRRGFSPVLMCHSCQWIATCKHCDSHITYHQPSKTAAYLHCHHCDAKHSVEVLCPQCKQPQIKPVGQGTEQLEDSLQKAFPDHKIIRLDRDSIQKKGSLEKKLTQIREGGAQILIGTQLLSKGHDFADITLVGVIDCDQSLFSTDFRATERLLQLITQVSGRAGRHQHPGQVMIQTAQPQHPLLQQWQTSGYLSCLNTLIQEREYALLPPFSSMALLRADSSQPPAQQQFLQQAITIAQQLKHPNIEWYGPVAALMERRGGRFRAQLLLQSPDKKSLQSFLDRFHPQLNTLKVPRHLRWSLDIDPQDIF
jgi:primosomal protein N' (replication factor Y) (superfamily II helicase)